MSSPNLIDLYQPSFDFKIFENSLLIDSAQNRKFILPTVLNHLFFSVISKQWAAPWKVSLWLLIHWCSSSVERVWWCSSSSTMRTPSSTSLGRLVVKEPCLSSASPMTWAQELPKQTETRENINYDLALDTPRPRGCRHGWWIQGPCPPRLKHFAPLPLANIVYLVSFSLRK